MPPPGPGGIWTSGSPAVLTAPGKDEAHGPGPGHPRLQPRSQACPKRCLLQPWKAVQPSVSHPFQAPHLVSASCSILGAPPEALPRGLSAPSSRPFRDSSFSGIPPAALWESEPFPPPCRRSRLSTWAAEVPTWTCQHLAHHRGSLHLGKPSLARCHSRAVLGMREGNSEHSVSWEPGAACRLGAAWPAVCEVKLPSGRQARSRHAKLS